MQIGLFLSRKTEVHLICAAVLESILEMLYFYLFWLVLFCCLNLLKHIHKEYCNANQPHTVNVNL